MHRGGVLGEDVGVVPGVVPDHDGVAGGGRRGSRRYAARPAAARMTTDPVHPVRARAERAAQAGGAELQAAVGTGPRGRRPPPPSGSLLARRRPGPSSSRAGVLVRVLGGPGAGPVEQLGRGPSCRCRSGRGRAARNASVAQRAADVRRLGLVARRRRRPGRRTARRRPAGGSPAPGPARGPTSRGCWPRRRRAPRSRGRARSGRPRTSAPRRRARARWTAPRRLSGCGRKLPIRAATASMP